MTKYAQQILDLVLCSTEHPTAEQIFLQMKQENSKIAQATVYNNLNALVAADRRRMQKGKLWPQGR